jgi:hypothetical protein
VADLATHQAAERPPREVESLDAVAQSHADVGTVDLDCTFGAKRIAPPLSKREQAFAKYSVGGNAKTTWRNALVTSLPVLHIL